MAALHEEIEKDDVQDILECKVESRGDQDGVGH
jgi:hypothetical protein